METIAVYYTPIASTKIMATFGFGIAFHMSLVFTDAMGRHFGATSGPSNQSVRHGPVAAIVAVVDAATNTPSVFGRLVSDRHNNTMFEKGSPQDFYTQDAYGNLYEPYIVAQGADLTSTWRSILKTYAAVDAYRFTYSPMSQNSNSLAGTALRRAQIAIPFSNETEFAPGVFVDLPIAASR